MLFLCVVANNVSLRILNDNLMNNRKRNSVVNTLYPLLSNILLSYALLVICQVVFVAVNFSMFPQLFANNSLLSIITGNLRFDTSAVGYLNALYFLLFLFPLHFKETKGFARFTKWVFIFFNGLGVVMNLMDTVYFQYTSRRTTATVFSEFKHEDNLAKIVGYELLHHWYLTLIAVGLIYLLIRWYRQPVEAHYKWWNYYSVRTLTLLAVIPCTVFAIRGGVGTAIRPITISNANRYVNNPLATAAILNTPFSVFRTIGKKPFVNPHYFSEKELPTIYTPVHQPVKNATFRKKNVVVFILESFGREYIGSLNSETRRYSPNYRGYTPFTDSLIAKSLSFKHAYANGRKSIDAMPSILSSIPMFVEPFFVTPASLNNVGGIARLLGRKDYYTAFFHGAPNGSMGFQAFSNTTGFKDYYGLSEYEKLPTYNKEKDFDGTWAIWDEEFFQFFCDKMSSFKPPFMTALFSASSHHPFVLPERYKGAFPAGDLPIHQCIGYTDHALKKFFEKASHQPWFKNTIFVLTSDHVNQIKYPLYATDYGRFAAPVIFYDPSGEIKGMSDQIAQQIDIMPTIMGYLGYDKPYISFGCDLLHTPKEKTFAVSYLNGIYQYTKGDYFLQFDGKHTVALYDKIKDPFLKKNLLEMQPKRVKWMERELKAIIQQYMARMVNNDLMVTKNEK